MASLADLKKKSIVTLEYKDADLDVEEWFECELPHKRMTLSALDAASRKKKNGQERIDTMVYAKMVFVPCVKAWSLDEECSTENKMELVGDNAVLNKMVENISMRLLRMSQASIDEEEGN